MRISKLKPCSTFLCLVKNLYIYFKFVVKAFSSLVLVCEYYVRKIEVRIRVVKKLHYKVVRQIMLDIQEPYYLIRRIRAIVATNGGSSRKLLSADICKMDDRR